MYNQWKTGNTTNMDVISPNMVNAIEFHWR